MHSMRRWDTSIPAGGTARIFRPQRTTNGDAMKGTTLSTRRRGAAAMTVLLCALGALGVSNPAHTTAPPEYEVYAVRYATLPSFRVSGLIAGADTSRRMDIAMMVWLLKGPNGRNVLVDAGFHRENFVNRWHPTGFM